MKTGDLCCLLGPYWVEVNSSLTGANRVGTKSHVVVWLGSVGIKGSSGEIIPGAWIMKPAGTVICVALQSLGRFP